jgi:anthranilate phosphoribosyltransferase
MVNTFYIHPADVGLPRATVADLAGGSAAENAELVTRVLNGEPGPRRDIVLLNAGAALLVAGVASSLEDGVARAGESIDSGRAAGTLEAFRQVSVS